MIDLFHYDLELDVRSSSLEIGCLRVGCLEFEDQRKCFSFVTGMFRILSSGCPFSVGKATEV